MKRVIRTSVAWVVLATFVLSLAGCSFGLPSLFNPRPPAATLAPEPRTIVATATPLPESAYAALQSDEELLINLYSRVSPSVVHIQVTTAQGGSGSGSGFFYDANGYIVTNNHVVEDTATIRVVLADGSQVPAEIIGTDVGSDLAVIRVSAPADLVVPATLGSSGEVRVGQWAVAIGNPFGLENTLTRGIVSALGRVFPQESGYSIANLVQTDAPINPGNSGGPLLDLRGRVIGVNTMIISESGSSAGLGFAIPVDMVKQVVPVLIRDGAYQHPWLGIHGYTITPELVDALDLPVDRGALISEVTSGGPAERAGVRGGSRTVSVPGYPDRVPSDGDIIVGIDGQPVSGMDSIIGYLDYTQVGQVVTLDVIRNGQRINLDVTLGARPGE